MDERESDYEICNCDSNDFGSLPLFKTHSLTPIDEVERLLPGRAPWGAKTATATRFFILLAKGCIGLFSSFFWKKDLI